MKTRYRKEIVKITSSGTYVFCVPRKQSSEAYFQLSLIIILSLLATLKTGTKVGITLAIIVIIVLVFFLVPVVGVSGENSAYLGTTQYTFTATVSLSFDLFHCGYVLNPTVTTSVVGYQAGQTIYPTGFYCNINVHPSTG